MKVVINRCFGGFGLSRAALHRLRELGCEAAKKEIDIGECYADGSVKSSFGNDSFCSDIERDDALLVSVVESMGKLANGGYAELSVVEIPDDVSWEVDDYDGMETVAEKHRSWS